MKTVSVCIDLSFCFLFLPLMMYMFPVERWWGIYPVYFSLFVAWLYITYFLWRYAIVPGFFRPGRARLGACLLAVITLCVTFAFSSYEISSPFYAIRRQLLDQYGGMLWGIRPHRQAVWLHFIIVVIFCLAVGMLHEAFRQRLARKEVEYARNKAELDFYKAQINPHFLFNTLNTIYGLFITHSNKAVPTLERFISITQYTYRNANRDFVLLSEEVEYISLYIDLQRMRLGTCARVDFEQHVSDGTVSVPPLLFITFVENAFKYGISSSDPCFVSIRLHQSENKLTFEVENTICNRPVQATRRMGISNCRKRLALLYPERHKLIISQTDDNLFRVKLELQTASI